MAAPQRYLTSLPRSLLSPFSQPVRPHSSVLTFLYPSQQQSRGARIKTKSSAKEKPKKKRPFFRQYDMKDAVQFTLCDAMRHIRAFEAGRELQSVKYEVHLKFKTRKNGPVIRNQITLPHAVRSDVRICVICPPDSKVGKEAAAAGAVLIGEDEVFEQVKAGKVNFEVCICHTASLPKLNKAGIARILGPKGLMPAAKLGTVVDNVGMTVRNMKAGSTYKEKTGVIRLSIGQLGFSPEELRTNLRALITQIKKDAAGVSDIVTKEIKEVVLSSTNAPGFILNGEFKSDKSPAAQALTGH